MEERLCLCLACASRQQESRCCTHLATEMALQVPFTSADLFGMQSMHLLSIFAILMQAILQRTHCNLPAMGIVCVEYLCLILIKCHWCAEAKADDEQEGDENINDGNRPANIQLDSTCRSGSGQTRWNVPPSTATAGAMSAAKRTSVLAKQVPAGSDPAPQTRRSTRTQPARKRKG